MHRTGNVQAIYIQSRPAQPEQVVVLTRLV